MTACVLLVVVGAPALAADLDQAMEYLQRGNFEAAADVLEQLTEDEPMNADGWYYLAMAYHADKKYEKAVMADLKAAEFQKTRASSLYNLACAYALQGKAIQAMESLDQAFEAGFLDYDLLQRDTDLESVRDMMTVPLPRHYPYQEIKAENGLRMRYHVIRPQAFDPETAYRALVAFPPGGWGELSADWAIENLWGETTGDTDWLVVVPVAPDDGWINHPAHHALEDLLDHLREEYVIDGDFHLTGFETGARPAATYSQMSNKYFRDLVTFSSYAWERWDEDELDDLDLPVYLVVGEDDEYGMEMTGRLLEHFDKDEVSMIAISGDDARLRSLRGGAMLTKIDELVR